MRYLLFLKKFDIDLNRLKNKIRRLDQNSRFIEEEKGIIVDSNLKTEKFLEMTEISKVILLNTDWIQFSFIGIKEKCLELCKNNKITNYKIETKFYNKIPISNKSIYRHINPYLKHEGINFNDSGETIHIEFKKSSNKCFYRIGNYKEDNKNALKVDMNNIIIIIENPSLVSEISDFLRLCWIFKLPLYIITQNKEFDKILRIAKEKTKGIDYNKFDLNITKDLPSGILLVGFSKHSDKNEKDMKGVLLSGKKIALIFGDDKYGLTQETRDKLDFCFRLTPELKKPLRGSQALSYILGFYTAYNL